jgi:hypothetical protein
MQTPQTADWPSGEAGKRSRSPSREGLAVDSGTPPVPAHVAQRLQRMLSLLAQTRQQLDEKDIHLRRERDALAEFKELEQELMAQLERVTAENQQLRQELTVSEKQLDRLQGYGLDTMTSQELADLVKSLTAAVDRVRITTQLRHLQHLSATHLSRPSSTSSLDSTDDIMADSCIHHGAGGSSHDRQRDSSQVSKGTGSRGTGSLRTGSRTASKGAGWTLRSTVEEETLSRQRLMPAVPPPSEVLSSRLSDGRSGGMIRPDSADLFD